MKYYKEKFIYDEKTGILSQIIGTKHSKGYLHFGLHGKHHFVHRFIWEMVNGKIPDGYQIDHINGKKTDNRIANLRLVTNDENHKNMPLHYRNKSGYNGVYQSKSGKWIGQININKKRFHLGTFDKKEDAAAAVKKAMVDNGYHNNHGRVV